MAWSSVSSKEQSGDKTARLQTEVEAVIQELRHVNLAMEEEGRINDILAQADALEQAYRAIFASDSESRIIRLITMAPHFSLFNIAKLRPSGDYPEWGG